MLRAAVLEKNPSFNPSFIGYLDLRLRIRCHMLREFIDNTDLELRPRIIPMLVLDAKKYPEELRPLIAQAIAIARSHSDEYIRHRVEIQLGGTGAQGARALR